MDEELTPGRGAADAAAAGSAAGSAGGSARGWRRLQDGLGEPGSWRTGEGGERDPLPAAGGDGGTVTARPDDAPSSLVELTGRAVRALRAATSGAEVGDPEGWRLTTREVLAGFADLGEARARLEVAEQVLLGEVLSRGLAQEAGFSVTDYVRQALGRRAPLPEMVAVSAAVQVARAAGRRDDATGVAGAAGVAGSRDRVPGADAVRDAVFSTALPVGRAAEIVRFAKDVAPVADESDLAEWVAGFVTIAGDRLEDSTGQLTEDGPALERDPDAPGAGRGADARELTRALQQARMLVKPAQDLEDDERRARMARVFTRTDGGCSATGLANYRLVLDPEGAAIIDAAVSALSAPQRLQDGTLEPGETTDPRSAATRRADALLDLVTRAAAAGGGNLGGTHGGNADADSDSSAGNSAGNNSESDKSSENRQPGAALGPRPGLGDKTQVLVTIDLDALTGMLDRAGITSTGEVLSPATVRRLACDAGIIPAILGSHGQVLDLGRTRRLFTPGQRLIVWRRDKHCTYPGCTVPATWCDVHHAHWWSRGGPTDLNNAALLCRRHHTHVHTHDLNATITECGVTWQPPPPVPPLRR